MLKRRKKKTKAKHQSCAKGCVSMKVGNRVWISKGVEGCVGALEDACLPWECVGFIRGHEEERVLAVLRLYESGAKWDRSRVSGDGRGDSVSLVAADTR